MTKQEITANRKITREYNRAYSEESVLFQAWNGERNAERRAELRALIGQNSIRLTSARLAYRAALKAAGF